MKLLLFYLPLFLVRLGCEILWCVEFVCCLFGGFFGKQESFPSFVEKEPCMVKDVVYLGKWGNKNNKMSFLICPPLFFLKGKGTSREKQTEEKKEKCWSFPFVELGERFFFFTWPGRLAVLITNRLLTTTG